LLIAFMCCFFWADRLQSLWHFGYLNNRSEPETSVAHARNLQTMVWNSASVMREAAIAVYDLRKANIRAHIRDRASLAKLYRMAHRWDRDKRLIRIRNNIGFHVAPKMIKKGIAEAVKAYFRLVLVAADDHTAGRTSLRAGLELLFMGSGMTAEEVDDILKIIVADTSAFSELVQTVFLDVLKTKGLI